MLASAAQAQGMAANPGKLPTPEQMMGVPVGGTHIPRSKMPQQVANPYEGNNDALTQGRELFHKMNCIGCHAAEGGGGIGPPLSDNNWIYGGEPAQIYLTIAQGRPNGMPSFANALPPQSIWKLVTYVRSLSKSQSAPINKTPPAKQTGAP
jgi:cytochrome c oxidase cbb3-type subunit 3